MVASFDVLIIGGGVNGTGLARDLAMRGFTVCLVEKKDFASGASGASSGMIHGGIRYLRYDRAVTKLSSIDSGYIQRIVPHLLFRIPFLMPLPAPDPSHPGLARRLWAYGVEVYFATYDRYQRLKRGLPSVRLSPEEAYALEPSLRRNAHAVLSTDEWGIDGPRLCLLNAVSAREHGATLLTGTELVRFTRAPDGAVTGAELRDDASGRTFAVAAKLTFNCTGPWAPLVAAKAGVRVRLRAGKGIHLILDRRISNYGVICTAVDGRQMFVMPHGETSMVGTTDDDYYGDLDSIPVTQDEIEYTVEAVESAVPGVRQATVVRATAGIRPTLYAWGEMEDALSREHAIYDHASQGAAGLHTLLGGKLASYRAQSQEAADLVCRKLARDVPCRTHLEPLPGGERFPDLKAAARTYRVSDLALDRLAHRQGANTEAILDLTAQDPALGAMLCPCEQVSWAEATWCLRHEMVGHLPELTQRCHVGLGSCQGTRCAVSAAHLFAAERKLKAEQMHRELAAFLQARFQQRRSVLAGSQMAQEELGRGVHLGSGNLDGTFR